MYDLLWALFKPNILVYTTCFGTGKPRCVLVNSGEEKTQKSGDKHYSIDCWYYNFDGEAFGEDFITLAIPKFCGTKLINSLQAFPLQYHSDKSGVKVDLVKCGRKFVFLLGACHRHCQGEAFFMDEGEVVKVSVDSRIMIDAAFFWKMKPNYIRPHTNLVDPESKSPAWARFNKMLKGQGRVKSNGIEPKEMKENDLLICSPTVLGFSFGDKL
jgi:hypothetical protein